MNLLGKIALVFLLFPLAFFGQEKIEQPLNARFVIKAQGGIPKPVSSNLFRKSFNGLYDAGASFNFRTVGNFYFGVGFQNFFFKNNSYLKMQVSAQTKLPYDTRFLANCPFVTFSYDRYFKKMSYVSYSLDYGYFIGKYTNVTNDTSKENKPFIDRSFAVQYIKPQVSLNFVDRDNPWVSFSVLLSYTTLIYKYDPRAPRFKQFGDLDKYSNRYYMSWFTVGFGLNVLLARNKE